MQKENTTKKQRKRAKKRKTKTKMKPQKQERQKLVPAHFCDRFGPLGEALADALLSFSFDIVSLVIAFLRGRCAWTGAAPARLQSFKPPRVADVCKNSCVGMAFDRNDNLWVTGGDTNVYV